MSKAREIVTLSALYGEAKKNTKNPLSEEEIRGINVRLMLLVQLSLLQQNIAWEVEQCFRKHNVYNFNIKHNHKKIVNYIKGNGNSDFWNHLTQEQIDALLCDADTIEDVIYRLVGLRGGSDNSGGDSINK